MNIEEKPALLIIDGETEILLKLDYLALPTNETTPLAASDEIL